MDENGLGEDYDTFNKVTKLVLVIACLIFIGLVILWSA